jgi:hypothetical protein
MSVLSHYNQAEPGSGDTRRIIERMVNAPNGRRLDHDFHHDMERNPLWQGFSPTTKADFRRIYNGLRRLGFEMGLRFESDFVAIEIRYGQRIARHNLADPAMISRGELFQAHLLQATVTLAQRTMMEVALAPEAHEPIYRRPLRPWRAEAELSRRTERLQGMPGPRRLPDVGHFGELEDPIGLRAPREPMGPTPESLEQTYRV